MNVALVEPEIPPNTGNVARLCAATRVPLHIVGMPGFRMDARAVRRADLTTGPRSFSSGTETSRLFTRPYPTRVSFTSRQKAISSIQTGLSKLTTVWSSGEKPVASLKTSCALTGTIA